MTVSSSSNKAGPFTANGLTTVFAFPYKVLKASDIKVYRTDTVTEQEEPLTTGFTTALVGDGSGGAVVTFAVAPVAGYEITLVREVNYLQDDYDPSPNSTYYAEVLEGAMDKRVMQIQQLKEQVDRAIKIPITAVGVSPDLPAPRAGAVIGSTDGESYENLDLVDAGQAIAGNWTVDRFQAGVGFTAGVSTLVTLTKAPASAASILVTFDGVVQHRNTYSVSTTTLTFTSPVPVGVSEVEVRIPTTLAVGLADGPVLADGSDTPRNMSERFADVVNVKDFGAKGDGVTDDAAALASALAAASASSSSIYIPNGTYYISDTEYIITSAVTIRGQSRSGTILRFNGNPAKTIRTNVVWRTEYNTGNYAASSDSAIACGFIIQSVGVTIQDLTILADYTAANNYTLPFNSATDYPTSVYDVGILVQRPGCTIERCDIIGPWLNAAVRGDASQPGGGIDRLKIINCKLSGMWGLRIEGASGQPVSGDQYSDLTVSDTRSSVGASDILVAGTEIYDTSASFRLTINSVPNKLVRRSATGGSLYINGQNSSNSYKRIQGMRFISCRFASCDRYVYKINYANRVEFLGCHSEFRSGGYNTDGVTLLTTADVEINSTPYSRRLSFIGGEKSGETDNRIYKDSANGIPIITELGYDDPSPPGSIAAKRMFQVDACRDRGLFTPTLFGATTPGTPTYGTQTGSYIKIGNLVFIQGRISLTSIGGIVGAVSIGGLPFTASAVFGTVPQALLANQTSGITTGDCGTGALVVQNTKTVSLLKIRSAASLQNITEADITATSRIDFSGIYQTEDA